MRGDLLITIKLLELSREHVREAGCELREASVETIRKSGEGFTIDLADGSVDAEYVIAASWADSDYLAELGVKTKSEEPGPVSVVPTNADGRTNVNGVYAAGRITSTHHQALVNAGDGARVALTLVNEVVPAFYNDWVAPEGYYAHYDREVPVGVEEISSEERRRRAKRGRRRMCEFFGRES